MLKIMRTALAASVMLAAVGTVRAEPITVEDAVAKAMIVAPSIDADQAAIEAARAGRKQAEVKPNPTVILEAEDFVGTGAFNVLGQSQVTASYSQPIERGGKRMARIALAERDIGVAQASATVTRLQIAAAVEDAFMDVLIADELYNAAQSTLAIELGLQKEALRRVRGYKDPLFVETRAAARVAEAEIGVDQAQARQVATRNSLAAYWGEAGDGLEVKGDLLAARQSPAQLANADVQLAEARVARANAAVRVEETKGIQDYTVSGGARFLRETNDVAVVASIAIPLGRYDRNQGNIERAQAEKIRLERTAEAQRLERLRGLATLRAEADAARNLAVKLEQQVYPKAVKTLAQVQQGYARGGFTFRDIQDAADAIIGVEERRLTAIVRYRKLQSEIDRLSGRFDPAAMETYP